ncbi:uncharacterized protein LOC127533054 [Acanthochromis polyacanthus]|uniref:uncharacterized protein LOC127533054 n=1 Tax=Acanthochromis polyacanthus TaxID=80966 RepID=UPI0022349CB8|nr:uncharacterized protein LOC127533054 [Acanthochromis polyacanthus]
MAGRRKRRSQQRKIEEEEPASYGVGTEEPAQQPLGELLGLMKDFMRGQEKREQGLRAEINNLRLSLQPPTPDPGEGPSGASSLHMALPTPAPGRRPQGDSTMVSQMQNDGLDQASHPPDPRPYVMEPKIPPYQMGEDIENYLLRFERIAKTWKWPEAEWACCLVPLLSGKALEAYTAMDEDEAHSYPELKAALLAKFDISPETYRQRFQSSTVPPGETPTETYHRLRSLYRRWIRPDQLTKEQIGELVILEQLLRVLPPDVRTWVREHEPEDGLTAAKLALQHQNARRGGPPRFTSSTPRPLQQSAPNRPTRETNYDSRGTPSSATNQQPTGKPFVCYYCQQQGHKASLCPIRRDKLTGACYAPRAEGELFIKQGLKEHTLKTVTLNGQEVTALLDSGSFTSRVKKDLVPVNCVDYS